MSATDEFIAETDKLLADFNEFCAKCQRFRPGTKNVTPGEPPLNCTLKAGHEGPCFDGAYSFTPRAIRTFTGYVKRRAGKDYSEPDFLVLA